MNYHINCTLSQKILPQDLEEQRVLKGKVIELGIGRAGFHSKFWHDRYLKLPTVLIIVNKNI